MFLFSPSFGLNVNWNFLTESGFDFINSNYLSTDNLLFGVIKISRNISAGYHITDVFYRSVNKVLTVLRYTQFLFAY